jgi:4-amino-4-deoxy-L-arabinose transferase-like glycosyltransferase
MEMLYATSLLLRDEILAKLTHWAFGLLSAIVLFKLLKRSLDTKFSLLGTLLFYTTLVLGWQSTTAYVDLTRTFFEILALTYFLSWLEKKGSWLWKSGLMMGLSLSTKHLGLETLLIFLILIFILSKNRLKNSIQFLGTSLGIALPWYLLAYLNTNNPFYPLFSGWFETSQIGDWGELWRPLAFLTSPWQMTFHLDNLISPIFLILLPLVLVKIWQQDKITKTIALYSFLGYLFWFLTPPSSARYLLPFIPALIFVYLKVLVSLKSSFQKIAIIAIILTCLLNLGSRAMVTKKFLPVVLGKETRGVFLSQNLNFDYGDFYDIDNYFQENIKANNLVLIYNIHNLYYVDFPFVHQSWAKPNTKFTHILIREIDLPEEYKEAKLIYKNEKTKVKLYQLD